MGTGVGGLEPFSEMTTSFRLRRSCNFCFIAFISALISFISSLYFEKSIYLFLKAGIGGVIIIY